MNWEKWWALEKYYKSVNLPLDCARNLSTGMKKTKNGTFLFKSIRNLHVLPEACTQTHTYTIVVEEGK